MKMIFIIILSPVYRKTAGTVCNNLILCNIVYYICYAEILSCLSQYEISDYTQQ